MIIFSFFDNYILPTKRGHEVRKHSVFNNYMIYKSTGHSEKQQMHKKSIQKKTAEEITVELITAIGPEHLKLRKK